MDVKLNLCHSEVIILIGCIFLQDSKEGDEDSGPENRAPEGDARGRGGGCNGVSQVRVLEKKVPNGWHRRFMKEWIQPKCDRRDTAPVAGECPR